MKVFGVAAQPYNYSRNNNVKFRQNIPDDRYIYIPLTFEEEKKEPSKTNLISNYTSKLSNLQQRIKNLPNDIKSHATSVTAAAVALPTGAKTVVETANEASKSIKKNLDEIRETWHSKDDKENTSASENNDPTEYHGANSTDPYEEFKHKPSDNNGGTTSTGGENDNEDPIHPDNDQDIDDNQHDDEADDNFDSGSDDGFDE